MTQIHHIAQRNTHLMLLVIAAFLMSMGSCKKEPSTPSNNPHDPNTLPPLTHEGKNTFGCLVNGEVWVAYAPFTVGGSETLEGNYYSDIGAMHLRANRINNNLNHNESIDLRIENLFSSGNYQLYGSHHLSKGLIDYSGAFNCSIYYIDTNLIRQINITFFSQQQRIISGIFEMDLVNPSCPGDTIRVREGRFDWRF